MNDNYYIRLRYHHSSCSSIDSLLFTPTEWILFQAIPTIMTQDLLDTLDFMQKLYKYEGATKFIPTKIVLVQPSRSGIRLMMSPATIGQGEIEEDYQKSFLENCARKQYVYELPAEPKLNLYH